MNFSTYEELADAVDQNGGLIVADMGKLRDTHGAGKLGSIVVNAIHEQLESHGLGHAPAELPTYQYERAIIYRKGAPVGRVVDAVTRIGDRSESILKEAVGKNAQSSIIVQRIRELVCD
jgi:hypothetical protein